MQDPTPDHRWLLPAFSAVLTAVWFQAFPLAARERLDWADVAMEGSYVIAVAAGFFFIPRLHIPILEVGWLVFFVSLFLEVLDLRTLHEVPGPGSTGQEAPPDGPG